MSMSEPLMTKCQYRVDGFHCDSGMLCDSVTGQATKLEDEEGDWANTCPACEGRGVLLTSAGRELLKFLKTFLVNAE